MIDPVLSSLNAVRAICFGPGPGTKTGAVKGEQARAEVAVALNNLWDTYCEHTGARPFISAARPSASEPWRDATWREQTALSLGTVICEDTGAVPLDGVCRVHGGDACLVASSALVVGLREVMAQRPSTPEAGDE